LVVIDQHVLALFDLIALDAVVLLDRLPGFGIDHLVVDAVAGLLIDDVEADALARGGRGIKRNRARNQRKFQITLPLRTWSHGITRRCYAIASGFNKAGGNRFPP